MANNFKQGIDRQVWVQTAPAQNAHAAGAGIACDLRNDASRNPFIYQLVSNSVVNRYNFKTKAWMFALAPSLAGTFGAGREVQPVAAYRGKAGALGTLFRCRCIFRFEKALTKSVG